MKFLFMDEKYSDPGAPPAARITALCGLLVPAAIHGEVRARFYDLLGKTLGNTRQRIAALPVIHASEIFPELGSDDQKRFDFVEGVVKIIASHNLRIFRVAYVRTPALQAVMDEIRTIGACFTGILSVLEQELRESRIWPVMETDRSNAQDAAFAGFIKNLDYLTTVLDAKSVSINNKNLGELLYSTKHSALGTLADFAAYLRHTRSIKDAGAALSPFKTRLLELAAPLDGAAAFDETVEMKFEPPPKGYVPDGPVRYMVKVEPGD